jgi:LysM repeat protein
LLLQGCKRDTKIGAAGETNTVSTNFTLPPIDTSYYTTTSSLPAETSSLYTTPAPASVESVPSPTSVRPREPLTSSGFEPRTPTSSFATPPPMTSSKEYTIVRGDTLSEIATANGISLANLQSANPGLDPRRLRVGAKIQIPPPDPTASRSSSSGISESNGSSGNLYTVKPGDNLTRIAKQHGVTVSQLRAANGLRTSAIRAGQKLKIPSGSSARGGTNTL